MIYNGVTEYLRHWCADMSRKYHERYMRGQGRAGENRLFIKRSFFEEMAYKVQSLVDREFPDFAAYREAVAGFVPLRRSYVLRNAKDPEAQKLLREAEEECLEFVENLKETDWASAVGYCRVLLGEERERLEYAILEKWGYSVHYWYPITGDFDESMLFLHVDHLEPYWELLGQILGLPEARLYACGESFFDDGQIEEVDELFGYGGNEVAYLPRDLSWIVYFSHEETVTFAGSILPKIRELLQNEKEHWNRWE